MKCSGHTYAGPHGRQKVIDYNIGSAAITDNLSFRGTLGRMGRRRQLTNTAAVRDHLLLGMGFPVTCCGPGEDKSKLGVTWDMEKIIQTIVTGRCRKAFLEDIEREFASTEANDPFERCQQGTVREGWRCILKKVGKIARRHFIAKGKAAPPTKEYEELGVQQQDLLERRPELRQSWRDGLEAEHQEVQDILKDIAATRKTLRRAYKEQLRGEICEELAQAIRKRHVAEAYEQIVLPAH